LRVGQLGSALPIAGVVAAAAARQEKMKLQ
jgi:hypothetical protein